MKRAIANPSYAFESAVHRQIRAEKMRTLAEEAPDPTVRAMMIKIAEDYDRLSRLVDVQVIQNFMMFKTSAEIGEQPDSRWSAATHDSRAEGLRPGSSPGAAEG